MFDSLSNILEGLGLALSGGQLHLIIDTPSTSGNQFLIFHLVRLVRKYNIVFVALSNTWSHYVNICTKLGVLLHDLVDKEEIKVIDFAKSAALPLLQDTPNLSAASNFLTSNFDFDIKSLFEKIQVSTEQFHSNDRPTAVLIDNVSPILCIGVKVENVDSLIQYCLTSLSGPDILVTSCTLDEVDQSSVYLTNRLKHRCGSFLQVRELTTGKSRNIHGELIFSVSKDILAPTGIRTIHKFHYKCEERDIKIFSPGLAQGIL